MTYQVVDDPIYLEWRPQQGSRLYEAIQAQKVAAAEYDVMAASLNDLQEQKAETQKAIGSIDWKADKETTKALFAEIPALDAMIASAQKDLQAAENELRLKTKEVDAQAGNLSSALKNVHHFEQLREDVPGRFTESDENRLKDYRAELARVSGAYLAG